MRLGVLFPTIAHLSPIEKPKLAYNNRDNGLITPGLQTYVYAYVYLYIKCEFCEKKIVCVYVHLCVLGYELVI